MENEKRVIKNYKIKKSVYNKAKKICDEKGGHLSVHVEMFVKCISEGAVINVKTIHGKKFKLS